jgi:flagellar biosynthetic protein FliQ
LVDWWVGSLVDWVVFFWLGWFVVALIVGLIVSVFQAATQINEATLSFIPKLLSVFITLLLVGPWMLSVLVGYMRGMFSNFSLLMG